MEPDTQEVNLLELNLTQNINSQTNFTTIIPFDITTLKIDVSFIAISYLNQFPQQKQICTLKDSKNSLQIVFSLITVNQLDSHRDTYQNVIKTISKVDGKITSEIKKEITNVKQSEIIKFEIMLQNKSYKQNQKIRLNFGPAINGQVCLFRFKMYSKIGNLSNNENFIMSSSTFTEKRFQSLAHQQYSRPFNFNIAKAFQAPSCEYLPSYEAPQLNQIQKKQLYVCHDMAGGYREDVNNYHHSNPISYRFMHLSQCSIFNYFSHHSITIPPMHWRKLCKKYGVKCLGTYIIQGNNNSEQIFLSDQVCNWLVYLAKKYCFDGYLINIEVMSIQNIKKLTSWLNNLTINLHKQVPNSITVWYDCISAITGKRQYQNCLSAHNILYLSVCDFYFTNYWWKDQTIIKSAAYAGQKGVSLKTFVGNDCFGRNTYGGGKENLFIAANKLLQKGISEHMNIALFAPGYAYQGEGQINRFNWLSKQREVFNGLTKKTVKLNSNSWTIEKNGANGWKYYEKQAQTSHEWCIRSYEYSLQQFMSQQDKTLHIYFTGYTGSNGKTGLSPYKIFMQFYDIQNNFILHDNGNYDEKMDLKLIQADKEQQFIESISISTSAISPSLVLRIVEMGKQFRPTGSSNGPYFKEQHIHFMIQIPQRNWIQKIPVLPISKLPYVTNFNMGHGDVFFYRGQKIQKSYGYMRDMDFPHTLQLNTLTSAFIDYNEAYIGGTSLKVLDNFINLLTFYSKQKKSVFIQLVCLGIQNKQIQIQLVNKELDENKKILLKGTQQDSGWIRFQSQQIILDKGNITLGIISNKSNFNVGELRITPKQMTETKVQVKEVNLYQSIKKNSQNFEIDLNFIINNNPNSYQDKVLVVIPKIFAGFIYANKNGMYIFANIKLQNFFEQKLRVQILMENGENNLKQIYSEEIKIIKIIDIIQPLIQQ